MGGTDQSLAQSLRMLDPTAGMTDGQRKEYIKGLAPTDQDRLRRAYTHYAVLVEQISDKPIQVDDLAGRDIYRFVNILQRRTEVKLKAFRLCGELRQGGFALSRKSHLTEKLRPARSFLLTYTI